jgi:hypothetical protein
MNVECLRTLRQTVVEYWSKIHDEELNNSYYFPNIVKALK